MLKNFLTILLLLTGVFASAQPDAAYTNSIKAYRQQYMTQHEVVKKKDAKYFRFFPIDPAYRVNCVFERIQDSIGFTMKTSANTLQHYYKYGQLDFTLAGKSCRLFVYQNSALMETKDYRDYLFVPFTDATTGDESYGSGRYLEFYIRDISNNTLELDFNKCYNPYCAYASGYHCPIPPNENNLTVAVKAGEKMFGKAHH